MAHHPSRGQLSFFVTIKAHMDRTPPYWVCPICKTQYAAGNQMAVMIDMDYHITNFHQKISHFLLKPTITDP